MKLILILIVVVVLCVVLYQLLLVDPFNVIVYQIKLYNSTLQDITVEIDNGKQIPIPSQSSEIVKLKDKDIISTNELSLTFDHTKLNKDDTIYISNSSISYSKHSTNSTLVQNNTPATIFVSLANTKISIEKGKSKSLNLQRSKTYKITTSELSYYVYISPVFPPHEIDVYSTRAVINN